MTATDLAPRAPTPRNIDLFPGWLAVGLLGRGRAMMLIRVVAPGAMIAGLLA